METSQPELGVDTRRPAQQGCRIWPLKPKPPRGRDAPRRRLGRRNTTRRRWAVASRPTHNRRPPQLSDKLVAADSLPRLIHAQRCQLLQLGATNGVSLKDL